MSCGPFIVIISYVSTNRYVPLWPAAINVPLIILKCFRKEDVPPTYKNHVALIPVHNSDTTPITKLAEIGGTS